MGSSGEDGLSDTTGLASSLPISIPVEIHTVSVPPNKKTLPALKQRLGEVFFPDDPLHQFKNQSFSKKLVLGLQYLFPIFQWGPQYSLKLLKCDAISGLTIASLAIPQGISYAKLASLPPVIGLYSSFVPPLIYSVLGSSRDLAVGPVSIASLVMGSMLREEVSPNKEPTLYLQLALTATFFAGVFQASLGFLRMGFIVDFLSKPTLTGFMGGSAVIVALQQLKGLLGILHFTNKMGLMPWKVEIFPITTSSAMKKIGRGGAKGPPVPAAAIANELGGEAGAEESPAPAAVTAKELGREAGAERPPVAAAS